MQRRRGKEGHGQEGEDEPCEKDSIAPNQGDAMKEAARQGRVAQLAVLRKAERGLESVERRCGASERAGHCAVGELKRNARILGGAEGYC